MKKIVTIIIIIAVIVGAFFFFRSGDKKVIAYETVELKKGSINNTVTATGTIEPITKVDVGKFPERFHTFTRITILSWKKDNYSPN